MIKRPIPPPVFDPASKARIAEKFKDIKPAEPSKRDPACICRWHAIDPDCQVRLDTARGCPVHTPPPQQG